jgi:predicted small lipoprotein YifL
LTNNFVNCRIEVKDTNFYWNGFDEIFTKGVRVMTTQEKNTNITNTNEPTEKKTNKKKAIGIVAVAAVTVAAVIIAMLTACGNKKPVATADEVIGTSVQSVTQVVTDAQGNTHIEEATKVVEVKQTQPAEKSEKATEANAENMAKTDSKQNNGSQSNNNSNGNSNQNNNNNNNAGNGSSGSTNKPASNSGSSGSSSQSKPSGGSSSSSSQSKPSSGSGSSSSSKPAPATQPATKDPHEGKTWHEAEYKTEKVWVVDEEACTWQRPIYEEHEAAICNTCGAEITDCYGEHMKEHMQKGENGSYRCETVRTLVGYETVNEPEVGHWETKTELVREAGWY